MAKVTALYHFLDVQACRNRLQGDEFEVSDERAAELLENGKVALVEKGKDLIKETEKEQSVKAPAKKQTKRK